MGSGKSNDRRRVGNSCSDGGLESMHIMKTIYRPSGISLAIEGMNGMYMMGRESGGVSSFPASFACSPTWFACMPYFPDLAPLAKHVP